MCVEEEEDTLSGIYTCTLCNVGCEIFVGNNCGDVVNRFSVFKVTQMPAWAKAQLLE